jgi:hypothetical protein
MFLKTIQQLPNNETNHIRYEPKLYGIEQFNTFRLYLQVGIISLKKQPLGVHTFGLAPFPLPVASPELQFREAYNIACDAD